VEHLKKNDSVTAVVVVLKSSYVILTLPDFDNRVVYSPTRNFNSNGTAGVSVSKFFKVGQRLKVNLMKLGSVSEKIKKVEGHLAQRSLASILASDYKSNPSSAAKSNSTSAPTDGKRVIKDPIDDSISALEDLGFGTTVKGKILSIKPTQMNVTLGSNLRGRVHVTELVSDISSLQDPKKPFKQYSVGEVLVFKVVGFHEDGKSHRFLPISHRNPTSKTIIELTLRSEDLAMESGVLSTDVTSRHTSFEEVSIGSIHHAFVAKVDADAVFLSLGPYLMGRSVGIESCTTIESGKDLSKAFQLGSAVSAMVISKNEAKKELDLSIRAASPTFAGVSFPLSIESLKIGMHCIGRVSKVTENVGLVIQLANHLYGRVILADISNSFIVNPTSAFEIGSVVEARVTKVDMKSANIELSLRDESPPPKTDDIIQGYIKNISDSGVFVNVGSGLVARVRITEISDSYVKDWKSLVNLGQLVKGRVLRYHYQYTSDVCFSYLIYFSVDLDNNRLEMTLKRSSVDPNYVHKGSSSTNSELTLSSLKKGMKVSGVIRSIQSFGAFIKIENTNLSGLCHITQVNIFYLFIFIFNNIILANADIR
jgi:rRNA biogenesis protein RRP5